MVSVTACLGAVSSAMGLFASSLGVTSFFLNQHALSRRHGANFQVKLGLEPPDGMAYSYYHFDDDRMLPPNDTAHLDFEGKIRARAYDVYNRQISTQKSRRIRDGGVWNGIFRTKTPGVQVDFMSVKGTDEPVCISWIVVNNYADLDTASGIWTGDIGRNCSQAWYPGNQVAGITEDGMDWRPACMWLAGNGSKHPIRPAASMKWAIPEYGSKKSNKTLYEGRACTSTIFSMQKDYLDDFRPETSYDGPSYHDLIPQEEGKRWVRSNKSMHSYSRESWMESQLIVSAMYPLHNATDLCRDPMSYGPDFIGADGYMCDMGTREVLPLCSFHEVNGCIDVDDKAKSLTRRSTVAKRHINTHHKNYVSIVNWS